MNSIPAFHYSRPVSRNGVPGAPADFFDGRMDGMGGGGWFDGVLRERHARRGSGFDHRLAATSVQQQLQQLNI